ncbi:MAG: hypothetical protein WD876_03970 [Candidatus Pacearchaeota archaeon]
MKNISIDSDVIISSEIETESNHKKSKEFMEHILTKKIKEIFFFTSIFTFLELGSAMMRRTKDKDKTYSLLYRISRSWKKIINPIPLSISKNKINPNIFSRDLIDDLIETSIKFNTRTGDTIQIQAILDGQIDCFITWNKKDFRVLERIIPHFRVLTPGEFLIEIGKMEKVELPKSYTKLIKLISKKSGVVKKEVERRIESKRARLSGLISKGGAAQVVAAELGVSFK